MSVLKMTLSTSVVYGCLHVANTLCNCLCKYIANNTDNTFHSVGWESLLWMSFASERTAKIAKHWVNQSIESFIWINWIWNSQNTCCVWYEIRVVSVYAIMEWVAKHFRNSVDLSFNRILKEKLVKNDYMFGKNA